MYLSLEERKFIVTRSNLNKLEYSFATIGLLFYWGTIQGILSPIGAEQLLKIIRYITLSISVCGLVIDYRNTYLTIRRGIWIWPLTGFALLSFIWSTQPAITIQGLRSDLIPLTLFALYLSTRFNRQQIFNLIYRTSLFSSIISIVYALALPDIGRHGLAHAYPGAWKGIFSHKNGLGFNLIVTVTGIILKILYPTSNSKSRVQTRNNLILLICIVISVLFSKSTSSLLISMLVAVLIISYQRFRWKGKSTAFMLHMLIMCSIMIVVAFSVLWHPVMLALGKDPTMSGRTLIWEYVLDYKVFPQSPILGFGRGVFWTTPSLFSGVFNIAHHIPAHAHNGYVDLLADLGIAGLLLFLLSLATVLWRVLKLSYCATELKNVWQLSFIMILLIGNVSESLLMRGANFSWLLYLVVCCSESREKI